MWLGIKLKVDHFKVYDSIVHIHVPEHKRVKLDDWSHKCILVWVSDESKMKQLVKEIGTWAHKS